MRRKLAPAVVVLVATSLTSTSAPHSVDDVTKSKALLKTMKRRDSVDPIHPYLPVQAFPLDKTGTYVIVPYSIDPNVEINAPDKFACIREIMDGYEDVSSLRFAAVPKTEAKYVLTAQNKRDAAGYALTSQRGGVTVTEFFDGPDKNYAPAWLVAHEIMHLLGFQHTKKLRESTLGIVDGLLRGRPYPYTASNYSRDSDVGHFPPPVDALAVRAVFGCHGVELDCGKAVNLHARPHPVESASSWVVEPDDRLRGSR